MRYDYAMYEKREYTIAPPDILGCGSRAAYTVVKIQNMTGTCAEGLNEQLSETQSQAVWVRVKQENAS